MKRNMRERRLETVFSSMVSHVRSVSPCTIMVQKGSLQEQAIGCLKSNGYNVDVEDRQTHIVATVW
jgi:hypothetical protein